MPPEFAQCRPGCCTFFGRPGRAARLLGRPGRTRELSDGLQRPSSDEIVAANAALEVVPVFATNSAHADRPGGLGWSLRANVCVLCDATRVDRCWSATRTSSLRGSVVATSNGNREAVVNVMSVWHGNPTAPRSDDWNTRASAATSVDRSFSQGKVYLFVPQDQSSPFQDNSCSLTREYTSDLSALAPTGARSYPEPGPPAPTGPLPLVLGAVAVAVVLVAGAVLIQSARTRPSDGTSV